PPDGRPPTVVGVDHLLPACLWLCRYSLWQPQLTGHGTPGPDCRRRGGGGRFALDADRRLSQFLHWAKLQWHGDPTGGRFRYSQLHVSLGHVLASARDAGLQRSGKLTDSLGLWGGNTCYVRYTTTVRTVHSTCCPRHARWECLKGERCQINRIRRLKRW